jgi:hypothetical protein
VLAKIQHKIIQIQQNVNDLLAGFLLPNQRKFHQEIGQENYNLLQK